MPTPNAFRVDHFTDEGLEYDPRDAYDASEDYPDTCTGCGDYTSPCSCDEPDEEEELPPDPFVWEGWGE